MSGILGLSYEALAQILEKLAVKLAGVHYLDLDEFQGIEGVFFSPVFFFGTGELVKTVDDAEQGSFERDF